MNTSKDEFVRGGGGTPPCAGLTSSALPKVQNPLVGENSNTGVSTINASNLNGSRDNIPHWYALRCTYGREKAAYEYFISKGINSFYPTITKSSSSSKSNTLITESRLPNIFFAHGTFDMLKKFVYDNVHDETKYIRFYYNQHHDGTKEPLIIPDRQIESLRLICNSNVEDILLEPFVVEKFLKGQHVVVKDGPFKGVEGVIARFQGQQRVGIAIEGLMTLVTAYIPTAYIDHIDYEKKR